MKGFMVRMELELANNSHKGDWKFFAVKENRNEIIDEIRHHFNKLIFAIIDDDEELIKEFSADIANIAMFMYNTVTK